MKINTIPMRWVLMNLAFHFFVISLIIGSDAPNMIMECSY